MADVTEKTLAEPFDHNDVTQTGPEAHALYREMRDKCPIGHSDQHGGFTFLLDYKDVNDVAHKPGLFGSFPNSVPHVPVPRPMVPLQVNPPDHQGYRTMLNPFFTPQRVATLEPAVRSFTAQLAEELAGRDEFDAFEMFAAPIPVFTLSTFFSLPEELHGEFQRLTHSFIHELTTDPESAMRAALELYAILGELLDERRAAPREGDLLSDIASGEVNGRPIEEEDALDICIVLALAGIDTTQNAIANSLRLLGHRPDLRHTLIDKPELFPTAVEELLRYEGPVQATGRTVSEDCTSLGINFSKEDPVLLVWMAANRDPKEFPDPEEVLLDRDPNRHLAFGAGIHRCLGAHVGRLELRVALEEFLRRIPDYEITDTLDDPNKWVTGIIRGPKTLPIKVI